MLPSLPRRRLAAAIAIAIAGLLVPRTGRAAAVLTSAEAHIRYTSPTACAVELTVAVSGAAEIEHRLEVLEGATATLDGTPGATVIGMRDIGRTRSIVLAPSSAGVAYTLQYHVAQAPSRPGRCPIWLPTVPASGRGRDVRLAVHVPDGSAAAGTMPTFTWQGSTGFAMSTHLPAFVIVPYAAGGESRPWDVSRVMDAAALSSIAVASVLWLRRRKGLH